MDLPNEVEEDETIRRLREELINKNKVKTSKEIYNSQTINNIPLDKENISQNRRANYARSNSLKNKQLLFNSTRVKVSSNNEFLKAKYIIIFNY
jgi:hypothetical protein